MSKNEEKKIPSVIRFEQVVKAKEYEKACQELLDILNKLDANFGTIDGIEIDIPMQLQNKELSEEATVYFCTRMANLITELFVNPELVITEKGALRFLNYQRWIGLIFACSPYINADHILATYHTGDEPFNGNNLRLDSSPSALAKFCIMYLSESNVLIDLDTLWSISPQLCASLCCVLQSPRFIGTETSFAKRAAILQWFPDKLAQCRLEKLPANIFHDVYMHCSYDIAANKHLVKKSVNKVIRDHLLSQGWVDRQVNSTKLKNGKPVMVVLLEHFHSAHSIYRTHSTSMIAARENFYLIGLGKNGVDEPARQVFDEFIELTEVFVLDKLHKVREVCEENGAAIFYMPSIGMDLTTIFASNTRLAPIQAVALGHPATTHSDFIEYVVVEDDYVGSEDCFSETLLRLPKDALPYVPSSLAPEKVEYKLRENPEVVNIGIASTTMKLNPYFLMALKAIRDRARVKVHFHFAAGQSTGITLPYVKRFVKSYLGESATVHGHKPYSEYMQVLHQCDMMVNPFPFGNTNGIIDMVTLGLVGICKTGPEVHEHIDEGLFKRLGLPEWLIANTVDEYVEQAIRLAENHKERLALRRKIIKNNGLKTLFSGDPSPMGNTFMEKLSAWAKEHNVDIGIKKAPKTASKSTPSKNTRTATKKTVDTKVQKTTVKKTVAKDSIAKKTATKSVKKEK